MGKKKNKNRKTLVTSRTLRYRIQIERTSMTTTLTQIHLSIGFIIIILNFSRPKELFSTFLSSRSTS